MRFLKDALLVVVSLALCVVAAEGVVRYIDGYPILLTPLGEPTGLASVKQDMVDKVPRAAGVDRDWFFVEPPPLEPGFTAMLRRPSADAAESLYDHPAPVPFQQGAPLQDAPPRSTRYSPASVPSP